MKKVERKRGKDLSREGTDEGLWDVVDDAAAGVEEDLQIERAETARRDFARRESEHGRESEQGGEFEQEVDEKEEERERMEREQENTDTEFETPLSSVGVEGTSYMPIQGAGGQARLDLPRIVTTTTHENGVAGLSTTTTTHIS